MSVRDELVGQDRAAETLRRAVAGDRHVMTHAWLSVGPPELGRFNAARASAAVLRYHDGGCGRCNDCRTSLSGAYPDVILLRTGQLSIGVDEMYQLVSRANVALVNRRWQVVAIEDTDRVIERGADALLKALEEPVLKTVWLLYAPSADGVIVTIRSRRRELRLVIPPAEEVAKLLVRCDSVDEVTAQHCACAAQGHVDRVWALALNEEARKRHHEVLSLPARLNTLTGCLLAAEFLVASTSKEAGQPTVDPGAREMAELQAALGMGTRWVKAREVQGAVRELKDQRKVRVKRSQRDALDRVLTELTGHYHDVLACQTAPGVSSVNANIVDEITVFAGRTRPEQVVHALGVLPEARKTLEGNAAPQLVFETMLLGLGRAPHC